MDDKENYTPREVANIATAYRSLMNTEDIGQLKLLYSRVPSKIRRHLGISDLIERVVDSNQEF